VDCLGRDEEDVSRLKRRRRLALDLILRRSLEDADDLLARMPVSERCSKPTCSGGAQTPSDCADAT
jgi:hypothetical protein